MLYPDLKRIKLSKEHSVNHAVGLLGRNGFPHPRLLHRFRDETQELPPSWKVKVYSARSVRPWTDVQNVPIANN